MDRSIFLRQAQMRRSICKIGFLVVFGVMFLLASGQALACAMLDHGDPKVGSTVIGPVNEITLTFTSGLIMAKSTLHVEDMQGHVVSNGNAYEKSDDPTLIAVKTPSLPPGKYKVVWKVLCECGSYTPGDYKFTITGAGSGS